MPKDIIKTRANFYIIEKQQFFIFDSPSACCRVIIFTKHWRISS
ncbi:Hypothetical protein SmN45_2638 [Serratia marcescens]|nr:Hypothetical protein SmN45_2638 [Serratia marcescens]